MSVPKAAIELLPSRSSILRAGIDEKSLISLVKEKVAEIMADREAIVFAPFFRSRRISYELKRLQTMPERKKWSVYFGRYGCLICKTSTRIHVGNGMCNACYSRTFSSLKQIIAEGVNRDPLEPGGASPDVFQRKLSEPKNRITKHRGNSRIRKS